METIKSAKALVITYLVNTTLSSLNGSDSNAGNESQIKKVSVGTEQFPYASSQVVRRAMRSQLSVMGEKMSESVASTIEKGVSTTMQDPYSFIDDDIFGYMGTESAEGKKKGRSIIRTSPLRVSPLVSMIPYRGDLDFGTNLMSKDSGGNPNIFETEIHSGIYRGTMLIELDRIGTGSGFEEKLLDNKERARRVICILDTIKNMWIVGRQTRFLSDVAPKFVVSAIMKTKNPIFQESIILDGNKVNSDLINIVLKDYKSEIISSVVGTRDNIINIDFAEKKSIGDAFEEMKKWIELYYN